jgi:hypothetical protein
VTLFAVFVVYSALLYGLARGVRWVFRRLRISPAIEAVTRILLGIAAAVVFVFIIRGLEALSLP